MLTIGRTGPFLAAGLLALLTVADTVWAQPSGDDATTQARGHNARARRAFNLGRFRQAAEHYRKAYEAKAVPAFLHNIAQCYARMSSVEDLEQALFYFESYLTNAPRSPHRQIVKEELAEIRQRLETARAADVAAKERTTVAATTTSTRAASTRAVPVPRSRPLYKRWWFWTAVGALVVGATAATVIAVQPEDTAPASGNLPPFQFTFE